jgi:CTP synthase
VGAPDVECIYQVTIHLANDGLDEKIGEILNIWSRSSGLENWKYVVHRITQPSHEVTIGIVGKYTALIESYKSLHEALVHGGIPNDTRVKLEYIESTDLLNPEEKLRHVDALLVPGGFGERGTEGMITAIKWARENKVPFFGICLGLQMAVIEFARHVCGLENANSAEFNQDAPHRVVDLMEEQRDVEDKGATMRLGAYPCRLKEGSLARRIYGKEEIGERHRHRYEVNNAYRERLEKHGMVMSGVSPDGKLVEIAELPDHPYFIGCQFHPEFKSKPFKPHQLFSGFIGAALKHKRERKA